MGTCEHALNCKFAHVALEEEAERPPGLQGGGAPNGAASSQAVEAPNSDSEARVWARIYLNNPHPSFNHFVQFLIGKHGMNMTEMHVKTQRLAKFRIRGIGSGHMEVNSNEEARVPLQLVVSLQTRHSSRLHHALGLAIHLLLKSV